ncbi:MAG: gspF [Actinomycetia bacterium]|nr:gspF [Actinomycetes bacterium]
MIAALVGTAWGVTVAVGAARWRPAPLRVDALRPVAPGRARWAVDPRLRRLAAAGGGAAVGLAVLPLAAPVLALGAWAVPVLRARRARRRPLEAVRRSLPEVVDLLTLAVGAGLTVPLAVAAVARRHEGPIGFELARVVSEAEHGARWSDALDAAAGRLGPAARPVLAALLASERYGAPLADALVVLAAEARADRRRRAEEAARRVPVRLLFPLVLCVLPAFVLLTLAPLLAGALGSLRL